MDVEQLFGVYGGVIFLQNVGSIGSDEWRGLCQGHLHPDLHQQAQRLQGMATTQLALQAKEGPEQEAERGDHQFDDIPQWRSRS